MPDEPDEPDKPDTPKVAPPTPDEGGGWFKPLAIGVGITLVGGLILDAVRRAQERRDGIVGWVPIRTVGGGDE